MDFCGKVVSLLFNMLSRFVIAFLSRSKHLLISWLQTLSAVILEPPKINSLTVSIVFPSICHELMGWDAMILVFWMLSFKPTFSLSSFSFIKRLFSSPCHKGGVITYLRLLIYLPAILIPACASSSSALHMMYSAQKLNKQGDNIQLDVLLSQFGTSQLFHVWFYLLFLDLKTGFLGDRQGGLVFPSLEEFSTVCCDSHSQRL